MLRRDVIAGVGSFAASAALADAADWAPSRPVTVVVPFPAGGATDVAARVIGEALSPVLGQQVVIENRPGANGAIGSQAVAAAAPDGLTLVMGGVNTQAMNDVLYKDLRYDSRKSFTPITLTARIPIAFVAHPSLGVSDLPGLIRLAKEKPGQLSYGSSGAGGPHHLAMELFKARAGIEIQHVPYKGGAQQLSDLLGGHIKLGAIGLPPVLANIKSGNLLGLAVTDPTRSSFLPELPTVAESGVPDFSVTYWLALFGPAGLPQPVIDRYHREVVAILGRPAVREKLGAQGVEILTSTPDALARLVVEEIERWRGVVEKARISIE